MDPERGRGGVGTHTLARREPTVGLPGSGGVVGRTRGDSMGKRIGIRFLDNVGGPRELIDLAVAAEEAGFDAFWIPNDVLRISPFPLLGAIAERTERIQIGLGSNPYTLDPSVIATFAATVDWMSGGRAILGIGMHTNDMFRWVGMDPADPLQRTKECVDIVRLLLDGEVAEYHGKEYDWDRSGYLRMKKPDRRIPIYVTPHGKDFMAMAGAIGDGAVPMITPPESAAEVVEAIHAGAIGAGRNPEDVDIIGFTWISIAEDGGVAREVMSDVVGYFGPYLDDFAIRSIGLTPEDFDPVREALKTMDPAKVRASVTPQMLRLGVLGTPDECCEQLSGIVNAGVDLISVGGPLGPDPMAAVELMGRTIVPHVHSL